MSASQAPTRGRFPLWLAPAALGVLGFLIVHPFDAQINDAVMGLAARLSGDLRRELFAWQQYGQATAIVVAALLIWLLDAPRRRRLLDLLLALGIAELVSMGGKMFIGRPRPKFGDPGTFLSPWGEYPIQTPGGYKLVHAWDTRSGASTDLWSMPSSHTLFAAVLSVFLAALYPQLRWLMLALTVLVGLGRLIFDAHWATDVIVGGAAGWLIGRIIIRRYAGVRLLDWVWTRFVNRAAQPAFPALLAAERTEGKPG